MKLRSKSAAILMFAGFLCARAEAVELIERARPRAIEQMQESPANASTLTVETKKSAPTLPPDELEQKLSEYLKVDDCKSVIDSVPGREYETVKPQVLAVLAYCEPPGKDPLKMFAYAEQKAPNDEIVLLLHGRYLWKHQMIEAEEIFVKLHSLTSDPKLKALAEQYIVGDNTLLIKKAPAVNFVAAAQIGGIQQTNPQGYALSDSRYGSNDSTGAVAQVAASGRRPFGVLSGGGDFVINDTTYWKTHDADLLTQDADLVLERRMGEHLLMGIRPFGSFYLLSGTRYYSLYGAGLTATIDHHFSETWLQVSIFKDDFAPTESAAQSGSHARFDFRSSLKALTDFQPVVFGYIDVNNAGADISNAQYIPYSHTEYGLGLSLNRLVHHYSVGLVVRTVYRVDNDQTRLIDENNQYVSKIRRDFQFVVQPNMTVPLASGLDLLMYFESNSISSTFEGSDGIDRRASDSVLGAVLRFSVTNF